MGISEQLAGKPNSKMLGQWILIAPLICSISLMDWTTYTSSTFLPLMMLKFYKSDDEHCIKET